jgi:membrane protease YdiL (CAAX protease family)
LQDQFSVLICQFSVKGNPLLASPDNPQFEPQPADNETPSAPALVPEVFPGGNSAAPSQASASAENPVWNGWDVLQIAGLAVLSVFVLQVVILFGARQFAYPHSPLREVAQKPILAILAQLVAYVVVALFMVLLIEGKYHVSFWPAIRWNWPGSKSAMLLGLGVLTVSLDLLSHFLPMPKSTPFEQFFARPRDAYLVAIFAVTLGPLMEEFFFRGFLYPVLARRMGVFWAIIFTALPFGLIHSVQYGNAWSAVLVIFLVGVVLTTVRAVTKSVAASFLVHVGYNGTLMLLAAIATGGFRHMEKAAFVMF